MKKSILKEPHSEKKLINTRLLYCAIVMLVLLIVLLTRLTYLGATQHHYYLAMQQKNLYKKIPIAPTRGIITDRNGVIVAENIPSYSLMITPDRIKNLSQTLNRLKALLPISDEDITAFKKQLSMHYRYDHIPLITKLSTQEIAKFSVNQYQFPGVSIAATLIRHYPLGSAMEAVVGTVGRINASDLKSIDRNNYADSDYIGKSGVEKYYEKALHGSVGYKTVETTVTGKVVKTVSVTPPIPGSTIRLSIDSRLQLAAIKAFGDRQGALVAIAPDTGKILAFVSNPSFDPNAFVTGISHKAYLALVHNPENPLFNRALKGLYPMASTIKPFLAIGALDRGIITADDQIHDPGYFKLPGSSHIFHDWFKGGHGIVSLARAIWVSCDTYFYILANKMGIQTLDQILKSFGFGSKPNIDLPGALKGLVPTPQWKQKALHQPWYPGDTVIAGIGQGYVQATPLQLADGVSIIANRGKRMQPSVVLSMKSQNTITTIAPHQIDFLKLSDPNDWETVINAMQNVITNTEGTGFRFGRDAPFTAAGKTGTAQVISRTAKSHYSVVPDNLRNHSLFIVFAPINHPKIAIAVIAEHSKIAPSIARAVMNVFFQHQNKDAS